jgi:Uma2 family endonuclease
MNTPAINQAGNRSEDVRNSRRSEHGGKLMPKAPGSRKVNLIATNTTIALGSRLSGQKTDIYVNGMRVQLKSNLLCYPDVVMVSGTPEFTDEHEDVLKNPTGVVEILSNSSDPMEKMQKVESYLAIPSIKECLIVKADEMRIEHYSRQNAKQWLYRIYDERDSVISLDSVNCKLSLSEIYGQVEAKPVVGASSAAVN